MISILVHNDLHCIYLYNLDNLSLNLCLTICIFHNFLDDSTSIAMQTNKQKLLFGDIVNVLLLLFAPYFNVLLDDVIAKLIVYQGIDVLVKILKDLIL